MAKVAVVVSVIFCGKKDRIAPQAVTLTIAQELDRGPVRLWLNHFGHTGRQSRRN